jgi:hypothetical protein
MARLTPDQLAQYRSIAADAIRAGATTSQAAESVRVACPECTQSQARAAVIYAYRQADIARASAATPAAPAFSPLRSGERAGQINPIVYTVETHVYNPQTRTWETRYISVVSQTEIPEQDVIDEAEGILDDEADYYEIASSGTMTSSVVGVYTRG